MARRLIRRYLPNFERIRTHPRLRFLGQRLHEPNLWHLNRASVAKAFAIGLFMAFVPVPFQMIPAAILAIYFRANMPISVALVWITNPLTMGPAYYFCYRIGAWLLSTPARPIDFELTLTWFSTELLRIWQPFLFGCLLVATLLALVGYHGMHWLWRWHVARDWEHRRTRKKPRATARR
jgi:uncharacterized protein